MTRTILTVGYVLALALLGGGLTAHYATAHFPGFGAFNTGVWTGFPASGSLFADPYMRALAARNGRVPLGSAEGFEMIADRDSDGNPLMGSCDYRIKGVVPANRLWTLRLVDIDRQPIAASPGATTRLHSRHALRNEAGAIDIALTNHAQPENWLELDKDGRFSVILTLYDTAIATGTGLAAFSLPEITKTRCAS